MFANISLSLFPQKFLYFVLKSSDVLDILVPILFYLNDARADQCEYVCVFQWEKERENVIMSPLLMGLMVFVCAAVARVGLMHIGVFILLLLSGERNFGVRLNKPYSLHVPMDIPVFTGTHADLLIIVRPRHCNTLKHCLHGTVQWTYRPATRQTCNYILLWWCWMLWTVLYSKWVFARVCLPACLLTV